MNGLGGGTLAACGGAAEKWEEGLTAGRTVGFQCLDNPKQDSGLEPLDGRAPIQTRGAAGEAGAG